MSMCITCHFPVGSGGNQHKKGCCPVKLGEGGVPVHGKRSSQRRGRAEIHKRGSGATRSVLATAGASFEGRPSWEQIKRARLAKRMAERKDARHR